MSANASAALTAAKKLLASKGLEQEFLSMAGLDSMDELSPLNFVEEKSEKTTPATKPSTSEDASPTPAPALAKSSADSRTGQQPSVASDILAPFAAVSVAYASKKKVSSYMPSSVMMFYIVHLMNNVLVDNFYFKRYCPDYHPYILRLYFGIIFWIQICRAAASVNRLPNDQHQFLTRFLAAHPLETLPIPGPLVPLFKTLCSSQPEILQYGKIYPAVPATPGPDVRSSAIRGNRTESFALPNILGIFALLEDLNEKINGTTPTYPAKGKHFPAQTFANAFTFGHHAFPAAATRTDAEFWYFASPGLEFACEADKALNTAFAERYDNFDFPATAAGDVTSILEVYLSMDSRMDWFNQVKDVAAAAALYTEGSGTLADCSPVGIVANQLQINYLSPTTAPVRPASFFAPTARFPLAYKATTTARSLPQLATTLAVMAQTHCRFPANHPWMSNYGNHTTREGHFWEIRPIESTTEDNESYLGLHALIKKMIKSKV